MIFRNRHNKIKKYRELKLSEDNEDSILTYDKKPSKILEARIQNYGMIDDISMKINDKSNQWVFIVGENGSGKTSLLRAIGSFLGYRLQESLELGLSDNFKAEMILGRGDQEEVYNREGNSNASGKRRPIVSGLAMYGPYRLDTTGKNLSRTKYNNLFSKEGSFKSLFDNGIPLLSLDKQFDFWKTGKKKERELFEKRKYFIISVLTDVVPNLFDIRFHDTGYTEYVFRDDYSTSSSCMSWQELPSGIKSTVLLIGDIMLRFYDQQRNTVDPSEFRGIVIVDEIDLHLHPAAQRDLIVNLSNTFPGLQFIVSTHSPIPLLGANERTVIFRMNRKFRTVSITRLTNLEKNLKELLPNHLLTSELFGLSSISSIQAKKNTEIVFTGSTMSDFVEYKEARDSGELKNADNKSFLKDLKKKLSEKSK